MTRLSLSLCLCLLACNPTADEPGCTRDIECPMQICVDEMCVDGTADAGPRQDASTGADTSVPVDAGPPSDAGLDAPVRIGEWILSIDNREENVVHALIRISVAEADYGAVSTICEDIALPDSIPSPNILSSLTFNDNTLYATAQGVENGDTLLRVDPCECTATVVGGYGYTHVAGITSNVDADMFGLSGVESVLLEINPTSAMTRLIRALDVEWTTVGLTAAPTEGMLWGISGATNELVLFNAADGAIVQTLDLSYNFGSVGMEYHPGVDKIFACSNTGELLVVDPETGNVDVGPVFAPDGCNNLAAPFGTVECIL